MKEMIRSFGLLAFLSMAVQALPAAAQEAAGVEPPLLPGLQQIIERGTLVIAVINQDAPPMIGTGADGTPTGFDIDLARAVAEGLGVKPTFDRKAETYDGVVRKVANGEADLGISYLSRTSRRARLVHFSRPYVTQHATLLINRLKGLRFRETCPSVAEILRSAEFSGLLGIQAASSHADYVRQLNPDAQPREFEKMGDLLVAVLAGEVAISVQGELAARSFLKENPDARIHLRLCEIGGVTDQIAIAIRPGQLDLLQWLNVFLDERGVAFDAAEVLANNGEWEF